MKSSTLKKLLSCNEALEWLESTIQNPENEDLDVDEPMRILLGKEWISEKEFFDFFKEISTQIASSASKSFNEETAEIFGIKILSGLSLYSPYYQLWEKAFATKSPGLQEEISVQDWDGELDPSIETMPLVSLIPHAMAYEPTIFEAIRNRTIIDLTYNQEEFLGYLVSSLLPGYFDGPLPVEIIHIPSTRILSEI